MFSLRHDDAANVLEIEARGFWDMATVAAFGAAAVARGSAIRLRRRHYAIFVDARGMSTQSGAVASAIALLLPKARLLTDGPIALVGANMLNKLQIDRLVSGERIRTFLDYDQARVWLHEEWIANRAA